ncbi:TonB-dependent receptor domain-containing protein [Mucilaginibacter celer]|uniref:TonB-dependent receptor n=1 Tax=Mucilaginibacter celer TaxID=2305508 RepID=A0A494W1A1_9SPHI|nr:TonB-dependent receptor [Mucilaginibacter celer]AYL97328.1 TonB-dependent receptor [Mucilaginibacter celer]
MKQILLTVLCCYFTTIIYAQTKTAAAAPAVANITVKGIIIDSAVNKPMGYVTVALQDAATKTPVKSTLAKDDGSFELKAPEGKTYQLVAVFIGYATKTIPVKLTGNTFNAGRILLSPSSKQLKEVTVTAVRPVMKQEVDRLSYDVTADPESKSITALDMIRKVPLLSVDGNDAIKLRGNDNYKILINGKESAMMAKNPSDVLKSMPAANIEKIEVITTPPAKYDAEGLAGIINIITKKNADQGYNVSLNTGYNSVYGERANVNLTVKQGKFGFSGYAGYNYRPMRSSAYENMTTFDSPASSLSQTGMRGNSGKNSYGSGELSFEIDTLNLLTGMFDFYNGKSNQENNQVTTFRDNLNNIKQFYRLFNSGDGDFNGSDVGLNYQLGFKKNKEQLLTISYKYNYNNNIQNNGATKGNDTIGTGSPADYRQYNRSGSKQHAFQLDYIQPSKILTVEAGGKVTLRNNYSQFNTDVKSDVDNEYHADTAQVNNFTYKQNIYGVYNSYSVKLSKWAFKGGMRLEHTTVDANFAVGKPTVNQDYDNFVPSVSVQRSLKSSSLTLGFTQRIQRPGIYQLNPYTDQTNPQYRNVGNPNLRAAVTNNFELGYSNFAKGSINLSTNYSFANNTVQNLASVDSAGVTTTTYANVGSNKNWGFDLNVNYPITPKLNVNINAELLFVWLKGYYNGSLFSNSGNQGHIFTYTSYKFDGGYRAGLNIGYDSRYVLLQGKDNYFFFSSISGSKTMFKEKVTLSLNVNNPFKKFNKLDFYTKGDGFETYTANNNFYRTINVSLSYKFGRLNSSIKKNQRGINNDDASSGGRN